MHPIPQNWHEARRLQAWRLRQQSWSQCQIAEVLGVSEAAVSQWRHRGREGGVQALHHRRPPGAPRRLAPEQRSRVPALLERGPSASGFRGQVWTRKRLAEVLRVEFGVVYHATHVGRLLRTLRWSPHKPMRRARQRDEAAMAPWREQTGPALKQGRMPKGKPSS
jgi:transposase